MRLIEVIKLIFNAYIIAAVLLVTVAIIRFLFIKLWRRVNFTGTGSSSLETPQDFRSQLDLLKRVSHKISEDRKRIEKSTFEARFNARECDVGKPELTPPSVHETTYDSLKKKCSEQNRQLNEIFESLENLRKGFSTLKREMPALNSDLARMQPSTALAIPLEAQHPFGNHTGQEANMNEDILMYILLVVKEYFSDFTSENISGRKKLIQTISRFLEQSQNNIKKDISTFCSTVTESDEGKNTSASLIHKVGKIEKNLIDTFTFLNRQCCNIENLKNILMCFKERLTHFATKFDAHCQESKAIVSQHLQEAEVLWTSVTEKINKTALVLTRQSKNLAALLSEMHTISQFWRQNAHFLRSFRQFDGTPHEVTNESAAEWIQNVDRVNEKLQSILSVSETSRENLDCLLQTTKSIKDFSNLMDSVAAGYNTLLNVFLSSLEKSRREIKEEPGKDEKKVRSVKGIDGTDVSAGQLAEINTGFPFEDDRIWNEVRNELNAAKPNTEFQNLDIDNIIFILRDVVRQTGQVVKKERTRSANECVTDSVQNNRIQDCDQWGEFPSEPTLLNEVSGDFLIQNSDESD